MFARGDPPVHGSDTMTMSDDVDTLSKAICNPFADSKFTAIVTFTTVTLLSEEKCRVMGVSSPQHKNTTLTF
jgi:hypothetical protein